MFLQLFLLALIPSILVLVLFFFSDRYEKEPLHMLFICFICGAALSLPITLLHSIIPGLSGIKFESSILTVLFRSFILAAFLEEGLKFIVVKRVVSRSRHFNEPFDGMLYYVAVAAGFAVYEDFTYILAGSADSFFAGKAAGNMAGFHAASLRMAALRSLPGHVFFGAISGYFFAQGRFQYPEKEQYFQNIALLCGITAHGIFNTLAFTIQKNTITVLILYLSLLLVVIFFMGRKLLAASPFKKPRVKLSVAELKALWDSKQYSTGNLGMFFLLLVFVMVAILVIFFINHFIRVLIV